MSEVTTGLDFDSTNITKKAAKILKVTDFNDKVVCFLSSWESDQFKAIPLDDGEKYYKEEESYIFQIAKSLLLSRGWFSFEVFKEKGEEKPNIAKEGYFSNKKLKDRFSSGKIQKLDILCIDYKYFYRTVLYHYLNWLEHWFDKKKVKTSPELKVLYKAFRMLPIVTHSQIINLVNKAVKNTLSTQEMDDLEYGSINHVQNISLPYIWQFIQKDGYLMSGNIPPFRSREEDAISTKDLDPVGPNTDIRMFYSFGALLLFELKRCLIRTKRCLNCGAPLKQATKAKYCYKGLKSYLKCKQKRGRERSKKHYESNKNLTR